MQIKKSFLLTATALMIGAGAQAQEKFAEPIVNDGITIKIPDVKKTLEKAKVKVSGYAQAQYIYADSENSKDNYSGFNIRRAAISVKGELTENWNAEIGFEIDSKGNGGKTNDIFVDKAILSYKNSTGKLTVGYQKTAFVLEEYTSSKIALCIEQSIASQYINKIAGLSGRHGGVWWDGKISNFKYGFALSNSNANDFDKASNGIALYGNIAYTLTADTFNAELGINATYNSGDDDALKSTAPTGEVFGIEPFFKITSGGFTGILDFLWVNGDNTVMKDAAFGFNTTLAYRMENNFEPVLRLSYLDSGKNQNIKASLLKNVPDGGSSTHENAKSAYLGINYYANKYVKISVGYEYSILNGGNAENEYSNALRVQFQANF